MTHKTAPLCDQFSNASLPEGWRALDIKSGSLSVPAYFIRAQNARANAVTINGLHSSPLHNSESIKELTEHGINVIALGLIPLAEHANYVAVNKQMIDDVLFDPDSEIFKLAPDMPHVLIAHSSSATLCLNAINETDKKAAAEQLYKGALYLAPFLEARRASPKYNPFGSRLYQAYAGAQKNSPILKNWIERTVMETKDRKLTDKDKNFCYGTPTHGHILALQSFGRSLSRIAHEAFSTARNSTDSTLDQKIMLSYDDNKVCNRTVQDYARARSIPVEIVTGRHSTLLTEPKSLKSIMRFIERHSLAVAPTPVQAANTNEKAGFFTTWRKRLGFDPSRNEAA